MERPCLDRQGHDVKDHVDPILVTLDLIQQVRCPGSSKQPPERRKPFDSIDHLADLRVDVADPLDGRADTADELATVQLPALLERPAELAEDNGQVRHSSGNVRDLFGSAADGGDEVVDGLGDLDPGSGDAGDAREERKRIHVFLLRLFHPQNGRRDTLEI